MFSKAIVRKPGRDLIHGLTSTNLGVPDYHQAVKQHKNYVDVLRKCGLDVDELDADEKYPDSTFVEDTALLTPHCAIITNPGALTRKGEVESIKRIVQKYYSNIETIKSPATVDGGDIMMVGSHFYIGLSQRTNIQGAREVIRILKKYKMTASIVEIKDMLHLKTGAAYLENNNLVVGGVFSDHPEFEKFNRIEVPDAESYAANCIWINGTVLIPAGYPLTGRKIRDAGYPVIEIDVSEFRKLDGGLSCLSLRF